MKFSFGDITNPNTGIKKDIVVETIMPNRIRDVAIGGSLVIAGIAYLTSTAFKYGAKKYGIAEFKTLDDLGLIGK